MSNAPEECEDNDCMGCDWCDQVCQWGYGSGMVGCLYDNGPEMTVSKEDAIKEALFVFQEVLTEEELKVATTELNLHHIYYFHGQEQRQRAGADLVEIWGPERPLGARLLTVNTIMTIAFDKCAHCGAFKNIQDGKGVYVCPYEQYHDVDQAAPTQRTGQKCGCNLGPGIHESWCREDAYKS